MKSSIKYLGVIDNNGNQHVVEFYNGVNVITGRSSTGKSAIIEIFDYCFGKKENTIPHGVITENTKIYFCVMAINDSFIVLARKSKSNTAFIRDETSSPHLEKLTLEYFSDDYFLPLDTFRNSLNNHFNLKVTDTDEDLEARLYRHNKAKSPRASVRNFVSFMLQHQNLIANKHALFYRFDEKEKREQTIDQFKIFLGFVNQEYYLKKQELADAERELKKLKLQAENNNKETQNIQITLKNLLNQYEYISGKKLPIDNVNQILTDPMNSFDKLNSFIITIEDNEEEFSSKYEEYKNSYEALDAKIHQKIIEMQQIKSSIKAGEKYNQSLKKINTIDSANLFESECPFCKSKNNNISNEANKLKNAINWLNEELIKTPILTNTFNIKEQEVKKEIADLKIQQKEIGRLKNEMEESVKSIKEQKSRFEQAMKVKVRVETLVQDKLISNNSELENRIHITEEKIKKIEEFLKINYNIDNKMSNAEKQINQNMNEIAEHLDFESTYKPVKLNF